MTKNVVGIELIGADATTVEENKFWDNVQDIEKFAL